MNRIKKAAVITALAALTTGGFFMHHHQQQARAERMAAACDKARRAAADMPDLLAMARRADSPTGEIRYLQERFESVASDCRRRGF